MSYAYIIIIIFQECEMECVIIFLCKSYFVFDASKRLNDTRLHFDGATSDFSSCNEGVDNGCISITPSSLQSCIHLLTILDKLNSNRILHFGWLNNSREASRIAGTLITLDKNRTLGNFQALREKNSSCNT